MSAQIWAMHRSAVILSLALSACSVPSPRFIGTAARVVETDGMRFRVHRRADEVEVHRLAGGGIRRESAVLLGAIRAIETATGCAVRPRSMRGDQSVIAAEIDCIG